MNTQQATELQTLRTRLRAIADRLRAIPFETPMNYTEYQALRTEREEIFHAILRAQRPPYSVYGIDVALTEVAE